MSSDSSESGERHDPGREWPREGAYDAQLSFDVPPVKAPEPIESIVKRDGRVVPFDRRKIADAIYRAIEPADGHSRVRAESLASGVTIYLAKRLAGQAPTVDQVNDAVERVLIEMGHVETALAFIRYRDKRSRIRQLRGGDMRAVLSELAEARTGDDAPAGVEPPSSLFVRTSDERLAGWNRLRIVDALVREARMERGLAELIAVEVERQIGAANVKTMTASLVRELVDAKLIEHGLEEYRRKHMRLGVPLYDAEQIICVPNQGESEMAQSPASTDVALANRVKREFALTQVFSQELADAHLAGDIHLHGLGYIDRLHRCTLSPDYVRRFGAGGTASRPPRDAGSLVSQLGQCHGAMQNHFGAGIRWDAVNCRLAPSMDGTDREAVQHLAHLLLVGLGRAGGLTGQRLPAGGIELCWNIPDHLREVPDSGRNRFVDCLPMARQFARAVLEAYLERELTGGKGTGTRLDVPIGSEFFDTPGSEAFLRDAVEVALRRGQVCFTFDRDGSAFPPPETSWQPLQVMLHAVSVNLPRAAMRAGSEGALGDFLEVQVNKAVRAHLEKREFIERLLAFGGLGPLGLLAARASGHPLLDLDRTVFGLGIVGLNECVQCLSGQQLHESDEALGLGIRIVARLNACCEHIGSRDDLRLVLGQTDDDRVCRRFATLDLHEHAEAAASLVKAHPVTQDLFYTPGAQLACGPSVNSIEHARCAGQFHRLVPGGARVPIILSEEQTSADAIVSFIQKVHFTTHARGLTFVQEYDLHRSA
jgi:ribonucleoside-triphosphate reductase (formate)